MKDHENSLLKESEKEFVPQSDLFSNSIHYLCNGNMVFSLMQYAEKYKCDWSLDLDRVEVKERKVSDEKTTAKILIDE